MEEEGEGEAGQGDEEEGRGGLKKVAKVPEARAELIICWNDGACHRYAIEEAEPGESFGNEGWFPVLFEIASRKSEP